ncbi:outer membrane protein assembly factor BamE [Planctomycetota bacterium]
MKKIVIVSILGFFLIGCEIEQTYQQAEQMKTQGITLQEVLAREKRNVNNLNRLEVGMTRGQVIQIMGNPYTREAFRQEELLFYLTNTFGAGDAGYTPIAIKDGKVLGWGRHFIGGNK